MSLAVKTIGGGPFNRCGMRFGPEPSIVSEKILGAKFDSPVVRENSPTIREVLFSERMLLCREVSAEEAAKLPAAALINKPV